MLLRAERALRPFSCARSAIRTHFGDSDFAMRLHFVTVPIHGSAPAEDELNSFLASRRVVAVDHQLVSDGPRSAWAVCVEYVDGSAVSSASKAANPNNKSIDYRDALPAEEFKVFSKLRELRAKFAKQEAVPHYAIFNNEQLAEMVRRKVRSTAELAGIDGIGPARIEKYGTSFLEVLCASLPAPPTPAPTPT